MGEKNEARDIDLEWENRVLCSDESCIGTIGLDGCCKECGSPYEGELPAHFHEPQAHREKAPAVAEDDDCDMSDESTEMKADAVEDPASDDEWERRTLCRDESCIGVINEENGCCKECGKPYRDD